MVLGIRMQQLPYRTLIRITIAQWFTQLTRYGQVSPSRLLKQTIHVYQYELLNLLIDLTLVVTKKDEIKQRANSKAKQRRYALFIKYYVKFTIFVFYNVVQFSDFLVEYFYLPLMKCLHSLQQKCICMDTLLQNR